MITALIDGDWILYAAGFAGQKTELICPAISEHIYPNITALRKERGWTEERAVYSRTILDEDSHFFHSAKMMIQKNCDKIEEKFGEKVKPVVLMDGDGNFRSRIATIRPYKGTRSVHAKPLKYNDLRQYLLDAWNAEVVHGQETDDEMAIRQTLSKDKTIIVAGDKDMLQVPGWHLNPNKGFRRVNEAHGRAFVYRQCITGDSVDNIGGAYKCGAKAAEAAINLDQTEEQMWDAVIHTYVNSIVKYGDHYNGLNAEEAATENMRLVYLRREPEELWMPPA